MKATVTISGFLTAALLALLPCPTTGLAAMASGSPASVFAGGTQTCQVSNDELTAARAQSIIVGTIVRRNSRRDSVAFSGGIFTDMDVVVRERLKGDVLEGEALRVVSPGGVVLDESGVYKGTRVSGFSFPSYSVGDTVLVYLSYDSSLGAYRVEYFFYRLDNGLVVGGRGIRDARQGSDISDAHMITEASLKSKIQADIDATSPMQLARRADAIVVSQITRVDELDPAKPGWGKDYTGDVVEVLRGDLDDDRIEIVVHMVEEVRPMLSERVLLFLCKQSPSGGYTIVGQFAGQYTVSGNVATASNGRTIHMDHFRTLLADTESNQ